MLQQNNEPVKPTTGMQSVLAGVGSAATTVAALTVGVEGKPKAILGALAALLALIAAFSRPPKKH